MFLVGLFVAVWCFVLGFAFGRITRPDRYDGNEDYDEYEEGFRAAHHLCHPHPDRCHKDRCAAARYDEG